MRAPKIPKLLVFLGQSKLDIVEKVQQELNENVIVPVVKIKKQKNGTVSIRLKKSEDVIKMAESFKNYLGDNVR